MIEWTEQALQQLDQANDYIALANAQEVARKITDRIVDCIQQLDMFPLSGGVGRVPMTREFVVPRTPFIAAYSVERNRVVILAIYHGAQCWPKTL